MALKFEELKVWQEARSLTLEAYLRTSHSPFNRDMSLKDQLRRASSSIMLNIAEGFDAGSNQQFIQFLFFALRSCSEVQSILYIAIDNNYLKRSEFSSLYESSQKIRMLCYGLIKYLKNPVKPKPVTKTGNR